ncbi:MAG: hypothetical protein FJY88_13720, partial [Candidatus Eisenbacteria bacterium]|nr:hypothetical protein [Candidatus Eisenbacteria bacterium]
MMNLSLPMANATPGKPRLTKVPRAIPVASVVLAFLVGATAAHAGAIRRVPTEYATIKAAVIAAETGDSILIAPGTYTGAENRAIDVGLKTLYIRGTGGAGTVVIDAENVANCFSFANSPFHYTSLQGLRLRRGNPCGIYVYDAAPVIMDSSIEDCVTGMLLARYHGTPSGLTIDGCVSTALKVSTGSNCEIRNSTIQNSAGAYGAGVQIIGASLLVANCVIRGNDASSDGGAVYCESGGVVLQDVAITGNRCAGAGGGIRLLNSSATLEYTTLSRNLAVSAAGGVSSAGSSSVVGHSILWG